MTEQHRAAPELWAAAERWGALNDSDSSCILELRDRVEALEAAQRAHIEAKAADARQLTLVDRVADAIASEPFLSSPTPVRKARAAIRVVAAWLCSEYPQTQCYAATWANRLHAEANR